MMARAALVVVGGMHVVVLLLDYDLLCMVAVVVAWQN
jgi:hypothetical protein